MSASTPIRLLIGGSPCTYWSIAQKNNRETEASGIGWELFKNYLVAKEKFKPDFFLYENNKSAAQPIKEQISRELGVELMYINSALVSAQNRQRFYAFNWHVEQPEDRGIMLRDILESGEPCRGEKAYCLDANYFRGGNTTRFESQSGMRLQVAEPIAIGVSFRGRYSDTGGRAVKGNGPIEQYLEARTDCKSNAITTVQKDYLCAEPIRIGDIGSTAQAHRVYSPDGKSVTLCAGGGGQGGKTGLYACPPEPIRVAEFNGGGQGNRIYDANAKSCAVKAQGGGHGGHGQGLYAVPTESTIGKKIYEVSNGEIEIKGKKYPIKLADGYYIIRKLTPIECERLQTLPDNYTAAVSASQRYRGLGNGWTAEVIIHILNGALGDIPRDTPLEVLSMYDGIGTGRYCLDKMGFTNVTYHAYEIDKYAIKVATSNYPDIIQHGDAFALREDDWALGGGK